MKKPLTLAGVVARPARPRSPFPAAAQAWPTKAVKVVVPQAPGGATDVFARYLGQRLSAKWGQAVVIENKAGRRGRGGHRRRSQVGARRLHVPLHLRGIAGGEPEPLREDTLRLGEGLPADRHGGDHSLPPRRRPEARRTRRSRTSSPLPRRSRARSPTPRRAAARSTTCSPNRSRSRPASTWSTCPTRRSPRP